MTETLEKLVSLRHVKLAEILAFMARSYGLGDFEALNAARQASLREEAEGMIDEHSAATSDAEPVEMASLDARLNRSEVGRLLNELHEIDEELLDIQDQDMDPEES